MDKKTTTKKDEVKEVEATEVAVEEVKEETPEVVAEPEAKAEAKPYEKKLKQVFVQPIKFDKEAMQRQVNKVRQRVCASAEVELYEAGKAVNPAAPSSEEVPYYDFKVTAEACQNQRRNGSKYCQACSDKHNSEVKTDTKND
jgi:hypothetical protein